MLKSPLKEVNDSVFTLTVCAIKDNGSLTMDDEDTEVSLLYIIMAIYKPREYTKRLQIFPSNSLC